MAATREQQRRYQAALRRVLAQFRDDPSTSDLYRERLAAALAAHDRRGTDGGEGD